MKEGFTMFKATRDFITARQKFTKYKLIALNNVKLVGGGEANKCLENATDIVEAGKAKGIAYYAISGWIVQRFNKEQNHTGIIQHWWNRDSEGNYFDTTPAYSFEGEYVIDLALYEYSRLNLEKIRSNVGYSLLYKNGKFELLRDDKNMIFEDIPDLRTELLFEHTE
jgi:hypothetical protein